MKKLITLSILTSLLLTACSSINSMDGFYDKYNKQGTVVAIPNIALKALGKLGGNAEFTEYLKSSKVFVMTNVTDGKMNRVMNDLKAGARGDKYSLPVKMKKGSKNLNVAMLEDKDRVKSLVLGISGFKSVLVLQSKVDVSKETLEKALDNVSEDFIDDVADILSL